MILNNEVLLSELDRTTDERLALIHGLLYENSIVMLSADPGAGKSTLLACLIAQCCKGDPVFGALEVPKPIRFYYLAFERGVSEIMERFRLMKTSISIPAANIWLSDSFMGFDMLKEENCESVIEQISLQTGNQIDVIAIDPCYAAVSGGLSKDENASGFTRFVNKLQGHFRCSIWLNHHTVKQSYDSQGNKYEKDDPFYGSQWLKANCTAAYYMKQTDKNVVELNCKKDSHGNLLSKIKLRFDPQTYLLYTIGEMKSSIRFKIFNWLTVTKKTKNLFNFNDLNEGVSCASIRSLRQEIAHLVKEGFIKNIKPLGEEALYEILKTS